MTLGKKIEMARREAGFNNQESLAIMVNVSRLTITRYENDQVQKPDIDLLQRISKVTGKSITYFIPESESDKFAINTINDLGGKAWPTTKALDKKPLLSWKEISTSPNIMDFLGGKKSGEDMFRTLLEDDDNEPDFKSGDEIEWTTNFQLENNRFYLVKDKKENKAILRQLRKFEHSAILRTSNLRIENEFNMQRFEMLGKIVKYTRHL